MKMSKQALHCHNLLPCTSTRNLAILHFQLQKYASGGVTWGESEDKLNHVCGFLSHIPKGERQFWLCSSGLLKVLYSVSLLDLVYCLYSTKDIEQNCHQIWIPNVEHFLPLDIPYIGFVPWIFYAIYLHVDVYIF